MTAVESSQADIRSDISSLKQDTSEIKSMLTKIYQALKGQASIPSNSIPQTTLAITEQTTNPESDKAEEEPTRLVSISTIKPTTRPNPEVSLIEFSSRPPLANPIFEIPIPKREGKAIATDDQPDVEKIRLDPKQIINAKAREKFKKAQDAENKVLQRQHIKKVKRPTEVNKKRAEQHMWTMSNRLKPEPITDVKIHPNSKPAVLTVYRNNDKMNFNVHNPFEFGDFGITELDELGLIIEKKKNYIVKDLMTSLGKRYERLKKIPKELGIQFALPAPIPEQASSQSLGRKKKHIELKPENKVPGLECNRSLLECVPFVNNMVIKEPEYGIFFTDVLGDQAF
uniref:Uncharacterized protein n=1 Tax=Tanacetum cinerariifolium TaxID=118510 RepID=A0A6L2PC99_TANCI|nr:hypothetical protein [Tanacetum cinerariifolium]